MLVPARVIIGGPQIVLDEVQRIIGFGEVTDSYSEFLDYPSDTFTITVDGINYHDVCIHGVLIDRSEGTRASVLIGFDGENYTTTEKRRYALVGVRGYSDNSWLLTPLQGVTEPLTDAEVERWLVKL